MEKIGIIDLGSNTARLLIVDMFTEGHYVVVDELKESVRLGQDMDRDGFLKPQRIAETIKTLKNIKKDGSRSREPSKYYKKEAQKPQHAKTFVVKHVVVPK